MATKTKAKAKMTEAEINKHIKRVKEEAEKHKKTLKKGENFATLDEEELRKKLQRVNSPFISFIGIGSAPPGGTFNVSVGLYNPDPVPQGSLYVHLFVGSGNPITDNGQFLLNVDARFPRLTQPSAGANLAASPGPGNSQTLNYTFKVPSTAEPSGYLCNIVLMRPNYFDVGTILDRGGFVFTVT